MAGVLFLGPLVALGLLLFSFATRDRMPNPAEWLLIAAIGLLMIHGQALGAALLMGLGEGDVTLSESKPSDDPKP